jgi:transcriptional regulator with XRE-family HTH domain
MAGLVARARRASGLSQAELARRAGTSRATLSAYEHERRKPNLETLERLLAVTGYELDLVPTISFTEHHDPVASSFFVPSALPRLSTEDAVARVALPRHLGSAGGHAIALGLRSDRIFAYSLILTEGKPDDVLHYIDGALLIDAWADLDISAAIRRAWQPLIDQARGGSAFQFLSRLKR